MHVLRSSQAFAQSQFGQTNRYYQRRHPVMGYGDADPLMELTSAQLISPETEQAIAAVVEKQMPAVMEILVQADGSVSYAPVLNITRTGEPYAHPAADSPANMPHRLNLVS